MHSTLASYWGKQDSKRRCCRLFGDWKLVPRICKNTLGTGTQNTMMANIALLVDMWLWARWLMDTIWSLSWRQVLVSNLTGHLVLFQFKKANNDFCTTAGQQTAYRVQIWWMLCHLPSAPLSLCVWADRTEWVYCSVWLFVAQETGESRQSYLDDYSLFLLYARPPYLLWIKQTRPKLILSLWPFVLNHQGHPSDKMTKTTCPSFRVTGLLLLVRSKLSTAWHSICKWILSIYQST